MSWAWKKFGQHWKVFVVGMLPLVLVGVAFYAGYFALFLPVWLDGMRGRTTSDAEVLEVFQHIALLYGALLMVMVPLSVVLALCTALGTALCYLPGLAFGAFAFFTLPIMVDQDLKLWVALRTSFAMVRDHLGLALLTVLVATLVTGAGGVACFVGVTVSVPVAILMQVYAYRAVIGGRVVP